MVDSVSLNVRKGEIVGLAGLMGAGRTELAMSLFGRSYGTATSGRVFRRGKEIKTRTVSEAIENGIAYATEDREALRPEPHRGHQAQHLHGRAPQARQGRLGRRDQETSRRQRLPEEPEHQGPGGRRHYGKLSGGNQQRWC